MSNALSRKWAAITVAVVAPLSLSGCFILPGEFTSEMTVRQSGDFSFSYKGQIQLVGLANILNSDMLNETIASAFNPVCWDETAIDAVTEPVEVTATEAVASSATPRSRFALMPVMPVALQVGADPDIATEEAVASDSLQMTERECTAEEIASQKKEWDEQEAAAKKRDDESKKLAAMMLGGIDPKDPKTITRFTKEVERLAAWHKVEHLGNGVFMIDYSTKGRLPDDFAFPVIPRYSLGEPMIHVTRWDNGRVRVEAPAFRTNPENSMMALLGAGSINGMMGGTSGTEKMPETLAIKGAFTLATDAIVLANNTEDGPEKIGDLHILRWDIGPATYGAPMTLLKMAN